MHESSYDDCGCCADVHFGALLNQTSRLIRRALDARINAEVSSELSGVRGMVLGDIVRAERQCRDVYQRDIEQWFNIRRSSVTAMLQGMEQDGFITRSAVAKDARLKRLIATEKGRACHKQIEASIARFEDDLQSGIDPQQARRGPRCRWSRPCATHSTSCKRKIPTKRGEIPIVKNTRT